MNKARKGKYESPVKATLAGISDLFKKQIPAGQLSSENRLDGQNVLITGASSGLGFAVSVQLAQRGACVYMACRSGIPEKGEEVKKRSGSDQVHMLPVDLSDLNSIHTLISHIKKQGIKFNRVICNAAIVPKESRKTKQGLEEMFMVNYLAKFILLNGLIKENCIFFSSENPPRIIIVSSESHRNPDFYDWEGFGKYKSYRMNKTVALYGYYKLLLTTFANELSRRLNRSPETVSSVLVLCPGPINSNIAREAPLLFQPLLKVVFKLFFRSPEKAAEPVIYLAVSPDEEGKMIDYLHIMTRKEMDAKATDPGNGKKLWELSEELVRSIV